MRRKNKKREEKTKEDGRSKESIKRVGNLGERRRDSEVGRESKKAGI